MNVLAILFRLSTLSVAAIAFAAAAAGPTGRVCKGQQAYAVRLVTEPESPSDRNREETRKHPEKTRLTLEDLESWAMSNNPSLTRAMALVGAARGNWIQVGLPPNPSAGYEGQQLGSGGRAEQQGVMFSQEIVRGGKLRLNREVADQELVRAEQELAAQEQRVLTDVRLAYYQALIAQRQIDLTDSLIRINTKGVKVADALFRAKETSRADVLQAQLEVESAQLLSQNARNRHDAVWRELSAVVGIRQLPPQPLEGDVFEPPKNFDFDESLARLQSLSPEIAIAVTEVSRARLALARARVEPIPNLNFQGVVNIIDNGIGGRPDGSVALTMPIPVFNRNQGAVFKAQHDVAAAEHALRQVELDLQSRFATTFERYANARNQVERYQSAILPVAQESLDLTRAIYEAGEAGFLVLLTAQRTFSQTNLTYLDALAELRKAEVEIEGALLRDSLGSRNSR